MGFGEAEFQRPGCGVWWGAQGSHTHASASTSIPGSWQVERAAPRPISPPAAPISDGPSGHRPGERALQSWDPPGALRTEIQSAEIPPRSTQVGRSGTEEPVPNQAIDSHVPEIGSTISYGYRHTPECGEKESEGWARQGMRSSQELACGSPCLAHPSLESWGPLPACAEPDLGWGPIRAAAGQGLGVASGQERQASATAG